MGFSYIYRSGGKYPRKSIQSQGIPVSLGEAYGYISKRNRAILLYIPCGTNSEKDTGSRLLITAGASMVEQAKESQQLNESAKEIRSLAEFTAQAARDMSRGWSKCPDSESLPDGPVVIHWNDYLIRNSWGSLVDDVADVRGFEVAGDDMGLALSAVEEPAGFAGEFGLVPGPVAVGKAALEVGVDQLVRVQLG
ncbi:hypothetical protein Strvi_2058 [Streptomyces violaceusniger Tu 4113]|uniref:Uncharacterized protein n=1 Tax=Streptomyces violaceusniger (strain Tu 4113) TaxID=653045 RepID=G2NTE3_STRV4|nr:hypothetical protein Strvi_2058 [Streptomyces violaceusniger Tu 4113]